MIDDHFDLTVLYSLLLFTGPDIVMVRASVSGVASLGPDMTESTVD